MSQRMLDEDGTTTGDGGQFTVSVAGLCMSCAQSVTVVAATQVLNTLACVLQCGCAGGDIGVMAMEAGR